MQRLTRYGGIAASIILIAFGIGSIVVGIDGRDQVRSDLAREQIVGTPDSSIPNQKVDTGSEARAFADVMRKHTLEATGGKTYAEMPRAIYKDTGKAVPEDKIDSAKESGAAIDNPLRQMWVTETALSTALNTAYFAESVSLFAIVMGIGVLLSGIGFLVLTIRLLGAPARKEATEAVKAPAAVPTTS